MTLRNGNAYRQPLPRPACRPTSSGLRWSTSVTRQPTPSPTWPNIQCVYHPRITKPLRLVRTAITFGEGSLKHRDIPVRHRDRSRGAVGDPGARVTSSGHPRRHSDARQRAKPVLRERCVGLNRSTSPVTDHLTRDLPLPGLRHRACRARIHRRRARQGNSRIPAYRRGALRLPCRSSHGPSVATTVGPFGVVPPCVQLRPCQASRRLDRVLDRSTSRQST